jgi:hypothetical protein
MGFWQILGRMAFGDDESVFTQMGIFSSHGSNCMGSTATRFSTVSNEPIPTYCGHRRARSSAFDIDFWCDSLNDFHV